MDASTLFLPSGLLLFHFSEKQKMVFSKEKKTYITTISLLCSQIYASPFPIRVLYPKKLHFSVLLLQL